MGQNNIRSWKKVFQSDLQYLMGELEDIIERPSILFIEGPVGAGKTTFGRHFLQQFAPLKMKTKDFAGSPTYSLLNDYGNIVHGDFYRLEKAEELLHLELPLYLENKDFCLLEWAFKFKHFLFREVPENFHFYRLDISIGRAEEDSPRSYELFQITRE